MPSSALTKDAFAFNSSELLPPSCPPATCRYQGVYEQRAGDRCDGCATFWNPDRFEAVGVDRIQLAQHGLKDNVALLVMLRTRGGSGSGSGGAVGGSGAEGADVAQGDEQARQEGACGSGQSGEGGGSVQVAAQGGKRRSGGEQQDEAVGRRRGRGPSLKDRFTQGGGSCPEDEVLALLPLSSAATAAAEAAAGGQDMAGRPPLLLVANTHVHFNPRRGDVKLGQLRVILDRCGLVSAVVVVCFTVLGGTARAHSARCSVRRSVGNV